MHRSLMDILVDPVSKAPFQIEQCQCEAGGRIVEGVLRSATGAGYPIINGIPRFVLTEDRDQKQTENSFGFKWGQKHSYASLKMHETARQWFVRRYGFAGIEEIRGFFQSRRRILDAGCGSGFSTSLWMGDDWRGNGRAEWVGADISGAIDVAQERLGHLAGTHFLQADVLQLPFSDHTFDTIVSEGVLHHTPSTEQALTSLSQLLGTGGEILFYVYRQKAPIREYTDDYIRGIVADMTPQDAWTMLRPLTRLGQALADLHAEVDVPEDVPLLGIKAGRYDVQRLIYWHFAKLFWNEGFSFEENNHVNFDWYHPRYAHRHTQDEVRSWCSKLGLSVAYFDVEPSGFTVRAIKD